VDEALRLSKKNNEKHVEGFSWIWLGKVLEKTEPPQIDKAEECILKGIGDLAWITAKTALCFRASIFR
jgi:hypothetical protein